MSQAEIIRQAIDRWEESETQRRRAQEAWQQTRAFIEERRAQGPVPGQGRTWTREEIYEERLSRYDRDTG